MAAPQATFRSTTRLIVQTISVTDKDGRAITGLTPRDFVVTEDGAPQDIAFVEFQQLAMDPADPARPPTVVAAPAATQTGAAATTMVQIATPPGGGIRYQDKRLLVFYFDLGSMPPPDFARAIINARTYVDSKLTASDLVAIMSFESGTVRVKIDFTDDRAALREVLQVLLYGEDKDGDGLRDPSDEGTAFGQDEGEFNVFNTDRQLAALQSALGMLRPLPEKKTLIYFTSGVRMNGSDNQAQMRATVNAAVRANVTLNPIDARGLVATPPLGDATRPSPGGMGMFTGSSALAMVSRFQQSQDALYALAKDTGGTALLDYNDLSVGIVRAAQATSSYYVIGYYSTHTDANGKFRRVSITLADPSRQAELDYRRGYYADKAFARFNAADKERQLEEALMLEDPITEITLAMEINYFQLNRAEYFVPVSVKIPGSELALARRGGAQRTSIDFIGEVKDDYGFTITNVRDKMENIKLTSDTAEQLAFRPIQYETGFTLLPGKYVIKILARDAETGRIGTFQMPFVIPNLMREEQRLPISSVVLSAQRVAMTEALFNAKNAATQVANPLVLDGQRLTPSVTRVFSRSRDLFVYLQAYERAAEAMQPLVAYVSFFKDGVHVLDTAPVAITAGMSGRANAVPIRLTIPLTALDTGRYECQVTVLHPDGQKAAFWQGGLAVVP